MADYRATSTEFTAVADAIRTKGGTSAQLTWPNGFVSAVQAIPTGSGVVQPLSVTQNGTYNPPSGVDGYAPVTVNVSGGGSSSVPILVDSKYVNGADMNTTLQYEPSGGEFTVVIVTTSGKAIGGLNILLNNVDVSSSFIHCDNTSAGSSLNVDAKTFNFSSGDVLAVSNKTASNNTGVQVFIFQGIDISDIIIVGAAGNNQSTFTIPGSNTAWRFEVAKYGYYQGINTIPETAVFHRDTSVSSTPCPNIDSYYYGGTYVLTIDDNV